MFGKPRRFYISLFFLSLWSMVPMLKSFDHVDHHQVWAASKENLWRCPRSQLVSYGGLSLKLETSLDLLPGIFVPKNFQIGRNSCRWARNPEPPQSQIRKTQHDKRSRFQPGTQRHPSKDVFFRGLLHGIKEASTTDRALQVSMPIALWNNIAKHERTSSHIWCNVSSLNFHEVSNSSKWGNEAYQAHEVEIWFGRGSLKISRSQRFTPSPCLKNTSNNISWSGNKSTSRFCWQKSSSTLSACTIEDIVHHISHLLLRSACVFWSPRGDCHRTGRNK